MTIRGEKQVVKAGVLFALAAHSIGGFKVGVGFALRKCRMCLATLESLSTEVCLSGYQFFHLSIIYMKIF